MKRNKRNPDLLIQLPEVEDRAGKVYPLSDQNAIHRIINIGNNRE